LDRFIVDVFNVDFFVVRRGSHGERLQARAREEPVLSRERDVDRRRC
jgi:hypothetical protein